MNAAAAVTAPSPEAVYAEFSIPVSRLCRRMLRNPSAAEDAALEAWYEILRSLPTFEGRSKLSTWIWTVARRAVFRHIKGEKTYSTRFLREFFSLHENDGLDEMDKIPVEDRTAWARIQCSECLTAILHCVPDEDRFVYLLRRVAMLPYAEIAEAVEKSEAAARQSSLRSSRKIQKFLSGECMLYNPNGSCRCKLRDPIRKLDAGEEYMKIRALSRRMYFLDAVDTLYQPPKDYWKNLVKGESGCHKEGRAVHS